MLTQGTGSVPLLLPPPLLLLVLSPSVYPNTHTHTLTLARRTRWLRWQRTLPGARVQRGTPGTRTSWRPSSKRLGHRSWRYNIGTGEIEPRWGHRSWGCNIGTGETKGRQRWGQPAWASPRPDEPQEMGVGVVVGDQEALRKTDEEEVYHPSPSHGYHGGPPQYTPPHRCGRGVRWTTRRSFASRASSTTSSRWTTWSGCRCAGDVREGAVCTDE